MNLISVVTPCYNEEGNVRLLAERVSKVFNQLENYDFEHIFADNASEDGTLDMLRQLAAEDVRVKVIVNARNFGQVRSVFNAIKSASGDAVVLLAADLQDPPEMIEDFLKKWEEGFEVVFGIREHREESALMTFLRKSYYRVLNVVSDDQLINDAGEFVLFDEKVLAILKRVDDHNPYIRGLISNMGYRVTGIPYRMARRFSGRSTTSLFPTFVYALNAFIHHSMFPLRIASFLGIASAAMCLLIAIAQFVLKLIFWDSYPLGLPSLSIGLFFLGSVQLFLMGYIGEIVGAIYYKSKGLPLVVERDRINFKSDG